MDSIMDNQDVTGEIMTNISVDLGNDDLFFSNTDKFGADKLNRITGDLVTAGILAGGANAGGHCEVYVSNGNIYIKPGIIVFGDGKKKTISEDFRISTIADAGDCYIYAYNNSIENSLEIKLNSSAPTSGDFVVLAQMVSGMVYDRRKYSTSKFANSGARLSQEITVPDITFLPSNEYKKIATIEIAVPHPAIIYGFVGYSSSHNANFIWDLIANKAGNTIFKFEDDEISFSWSRVKFQINANGDLEIYAREIGSISGNKNWLFQLHIV